MTEVLLCATDAGGVRNLTAVLVELSARNIQATFLTRQKMRGLFTAETARGVKFVDTDDDAAADVVERTVPAAVICGTTRHASPDREMIRAARAAGVRSVVAVDEWYNYRYRFSDAGTEGGLSLPDAIALPDELAVREAADEGIPEALCHATGSPSLSALVDIRERWRISVPPLPRILSDRRSGPVITFLSETHATDYGASRGASGSMGSYLGYTERTVRETLLAVAGELGRDAVFVDKLHPSDDDDTTPDSIPKNVDYRVSRDAPTLDLCFHSDAIAGMRSMALLEAALLRSNVASFQPGRLGAEQCTAVRLGLVPLIESAEKLLGWLNRTLTADRAALETSRPAFASADAAQRIVDLALGVALR